VTFSIGGIILFNTSTIIARNWKGDGVGHVAVKLFILDICVVHASRRSFWHENFMGFHDGGNYGYLQEVLFDTAGGEAVPVDVGRYCVVSVM
jgi:hypothetical protein